MGSQQVTHLIDNNDRILTFDLTVVILSVGYWDEVFYLRLEGAAPNREILSASLDQSHKAKLLSSSVCERNSYEDSNTSKCFLVERWSLQNNSPEQK